MNWPAALVAAGAGLALALAQPPLAMPLLALLVPALLVAAVDLAARAGRPAWTVGGLAGGLGHGILLWWLVLPAGYLGWGLLTLVHVGWWALLAAVVRWAPRGPVRPLVVAVVWVGIDAVRGVVPLNGFAWGTLGAATVDLPWLAPLARIAGEKAITLAVVLLSVGAWEALRRPVEAARGPDGQLAWPRVRDHLRAANAGVAWLAGTGLVVTMATVGPPPSTGSADVLLVQPSGPSAWSGTGAELDVAIASSAVELTRDAVAEDGVPDLTVWPESTIDSDPERVPGLADALAAGGEATGGRLLVGANLDGPRPATFHNTALAIGEEGQATAGYDKRRLVPFGEYLPLRSVLGDLPMLQQVARDALPGGAPDAVTVTDDLRVAVAICFETLFGGLVRENVLTGDEPASLVAALTNDASFGESGEARQHIAQSQLRALETGRWVVHAAISGQSAFVSPDGTVHDLTRHFEATTRRRSLSLVEGRTPFLVTGDWLGPATTAGLAALALVALRHRRETIRQEGP